MVATNRIVRNERLLQSIASAGIITEEGKNAIIQALDPMHDLPVDHLVGWPDMETAPSIVQCIKQTVQVTNTLDGNPFDLHLCIFPFVNQQRYTPVISRINSMIGNPTNEGNFFATPLTILGGLTIFQTAVGAPCNLSTSPVVARLTLDDTFVHGPCRVVGMGYEVCNTTADLYKSGQVLCYRLPQPYNKPSAYTYFTPANLPATDSGGGPAVVPYILPATCQLFRPPVPDAASMMLIAGTRQWKAEDGVYQVVPLVCGPDNPPMVGDYTQPIFSAFGNAEDQPDGDTLGPVNTGPVIVPTVWSTAIPGETGPISPWAELPCCRIMPVQQCGSLFTGLTPQSTLTVTFNVYLETFPGFAEKTLLTLATPSCPFDPVALQCISRAFLNLPVGVPFADNGLGEAFAETLADMADVIAPIAMAVGQPGIAAAVLGGGRIARGVQHYLAGPSPQEGMKAAKEYGASLPAAKKSNGPSRASATSGPRIVTVNASHEVAARSKARKPRVRKNKGKNSNMQTRRSRMQL